MHLGAAVVLKNWSLYGNSWVWVGLSCYAPVKTLNGFKIRTASEALDAKVQSQKGNSP